MEDLKFYDDTKEKELKREIRRAKGRNLKIGLYSFIGASVLVSALFLNPSEIVSEINTSGTTLIKETGSKLRFGGKSISEIEAEVELLQEELDILEDDCDAMQDRIDKLEKFVEAYYSVVK